MTYLMPWGTPIDIAAARELAVRLCEYACNGSKGRPEKGDPVYDAVTEHRDTGSRYSSCADLAHWMLFRLGVRLGCINRAEHAGWAQGKNISKLAWCSAAKEVESNQRFEPGDILIIWSQKDSSDSHATIVLRDGRIDGSGNELETANYGAPGGKLSTSPVVVREIAFTQYQQLGSRLIHRWIPLDVMLNMAAAAGHLSAAEDPTRDSEGTPSWRLDDA
jgi:hypothetical protein